MAKTLPDTASALEVAVCAALVCAPDAGLAELDPKRYPVVSGLGKLALALDEGPLNDAQSLHKQRTHRIPLVAACWILWYLPETTQVPIRGDLAEALRRQPDLLECARRFLAGEKVPVRRD